jgi:hypothetical protein
MKVSTNQEKLCPIHRSTIAMSGSPDSRPFHPSQVGKQADDSTTSRILDSLPTLCSTSINTMQRSAANTKPLPDLRCTASMRARRIIYPNASAGSKA